jgi:DtxR family transcriptional regulator, Mn-dependent transcriptional regulator
MREAKGHRHGYEAATTRAEVELTDAAEEVLAALYPEPEAGAACAVPTAAEGQEAEQELLGHGLIELSEAGATLTEAGLAAAAAVVRRERLAERLLADVLRVNDAVASEAACKFEHLLRKGIDDNICTLLGHPRVCPHGSPIPPGPCCAAGSVAAGKVVSSLADLSPGQGGTIAYLQSQRREVVQRLLAMGAIPGAPIILQQKFPSLVLEIGNAQIAIDEATARDIYVRLSRRPRAASRWGGGLRLPGRHRRHGG